MYYKQKFWKRKLGAEKKRKCKTQFYLKMLTKKMKVNGAVKFYILAWMYTSVLFNVLSNEGFSLSGTFSHDVMAANVTGVPKHWNDAHTTDVVVRNKPRKGFLLFQSICIDAGHVSENALYILLNKANVQVNIVITFILTKPSDPKCFDSLFNSFPICFNCSSRARLHQENAFLFTVTVIEVFVTFIWKNKETLSATEKFFKRFIMFNCHISFYINIYT